MIEQIDWLKVDLHNHSPASLIEKPNDEIKKYLTNHGLKIPKLDNEIDVDIICEKYCYDVIERIKRNKINFFSITDHNFFSYKYFSKIKNDLKEQNINCLILPGLEQDLYFNLEDNENPYKHFLIIFNDSYFKNNKDFIDLSKMIREFNLKKNNNLSKFISFFVKYEYFLIPHSTQKDSKRGIDVNLDTYKNLHKFLRYSFIPALEGNKEDLKKISEAIIEQYKNIKCLDFVFLKFSDNHDPSCEKDNDSWTYFKTRKSFNGIKISLLNSEKRIKLTYEKPVIKTLNKIKTVNFKIIDANSKDKVLSESSINFSPDFNCVIGNRSSGKSLLLHAIADPNLKENKTKKYFRVKGGKNAPFSLDIELKDFDDEKINNPYSRIKFISQEDLINKLINDDNDDLDENYISNYYYSSRDNHQQLNNNSLNVLLDQIKIKTLDMINDIEKIVNFNSFDFKNILKNFSSIKILQFNYSKTPIFSTINNANNSMLNYIKSLEEMGKDSILALNVSDNLTIKRSYEILNEYILGRKNYYSKKKTFFEILEKKSVECLEIQINNHYDILKNHFILKRNILKFEIDCIEKYENWELIKEFIINDNKKYLFIKRLKKLSKTNFLFLFKEVFDKEFNSIKNVIKFLMEDEKNSASLLKNVKDKIDVFFTINREIILSDLGKQQSITNLSEGTKALSLLEIILSDETNDLDKSIIIIDQPEDNIDNTGIYEMTLNNLVKNRFRNQIIFSSHSANIVVNGDSENIILCNKENNQFIYETTCFEESNSIKKICRILEGGKEAFEKRGWKYINGENND